MTKTPSSGSRGLAERVHTARKRKHSSTLWLHRQLNDPYVAEAKRQGFRSRAAFKLVEMDDKYRLLKPGLRVVDLGAAPGGWSQVAVDRVKAEQGRGFVVGIDLLPVDPIPGATILMGDFSADAAPGQLKALMHGPADLVMSDMAADTTGHRPTDHLRTLGLAEIAVAFAVEVLAPGGAFLCKLFQGGETRLLLEHLKRDFTQVRHVKPPASRADSVEMYVLATGFRGGTATPPDAD
jgi:23S rRNA (uridine2552-2'-O)-methyltransferase